MEHSTFMRFIAILVTLFVISFFLPQTALAVGAWAGAVFVLGLAMFFWPTDREKSRSRR